jgi:hypothetical protein
MARLNNTIKFILINVNIIFCVVGLFLVGSSLYLLTGKFGELDPGFFIGTGLIILFTGLSIAVGSCLGCQGLNNQGQKLGMCVRDRAQRLCNTEYINFKKFNIIPSRFILDW